MTAMWRERLARYRNTPKNYHLLLGQQIFDEQGRLWMATQRDRDEFSYLDVYNGTPTVGEPRTWVCESTYRASGPVSAGSCRSSSRNMERLRPWWRYGCEDRRGDPQGVRPKPKGSGRDRWGNRVVEGPQLGEKALADVFAAKELEIGLAGVRSQVHG